MSINFNASIFDLLSIPSNSSFKNVEKNYKEQMLRLNPDKGGNLFFSQVLNAKWLEFKNGNEFSDEEDVPCGQGNPPPSPQPSTQESTHSQTNADILNVPDSMKNFINENAVHGNWFLIISEETVDNDKAVKDWVSGNLPKDVSALVMNFENRVMVLLHCKNRCRFENLKKRLLLPIIYKTYVVKGRLSSELIGLFRTKASWKNCGEENPLIDEASKFQQILFNDFVLEHDLTTDMSMYVYRAFAKNAPQGNPGYDCHCALSENFDMTPGRWPHEFAVHVNHYQNATLFMKQPRHHDILKAAQFIRSNEKIIEKKFISNSKFGNNKWQTFLQNQEETPIDLENVISFLKLFGIIQFENESEQMAYCLKSFYDFHLKVNALCCRARIRRRCLILHGQFQTYKSTVAFIMKDIFDGASVQINAENIHPFLASCIEKRIAIMDDLNTDHFKILDRRLRPYLDGQHVPLKKLYTDPIECQMPPIVITTNVNPDKIPIGIKTRSSSFHMQNALDVGDAIPQSKNIYFAALKLFFEAKNEPLPEKFFFEDEMPSMGADDIQSSQNKFSQFANSVSNFM